MFFYFFIFFLFLSSVMIIGRASLLPFKKFDININFLSLNLSLGFFVIGSISFAYNFFSAIHDLIFIFLLSLLLMYSIFRVFVLEKNFKVISKHLLIICILCFFFFFYSNQLPPGYDAGLYHIPHQVFIQNEKIIFGLVNMHSRFGLSTFYNYIAAIFWKDNNFTLISFLQSSYLIIFFIFLYEIIKKNISIFNIVVLTTALTMPIWFRYVIPGYAIVDLSYGIYFYFSVILSLLIFANKENLSNTYIFYFILSCSLAFMHKSNGAQLLPLFLVTLSFAIRRNYISCANCFKLLMIPSFFVLLWIVRGTIISGCLVYPVEMTCLNFSWMPVSEANETYVVIKNWALRGYNLLSIKLYYQFFIPLLILIFFLILIINRIKTLKLLFNHYFFWIVSLFCLIYIYSQASPLSGFSALVTDQKVNEASFILKKEIIIIFLSNFFAIIFSTSISQFFNYYNINFKESFYSKIPFLFTVAYLIIWLMTAPNPRFAFGAFALISPMCITFFFPNFFIKSSKNLSVLTKLILFLIIFKLTLMDAFINSKLKFLIKQVPEIETIKRNGFGRAPVDIVKENRCWLIKNCYFYDEDILVKKYFLNYKVFLKNNK